MGDAILFIDHVPDRHARQRAQVEGLSARSGIEGSAVEVHAPAVVGCLNDARAKLAEITILIVETFGQHVD